MADASNIAETPQIRIAHTLPLSMGQFALALAGHKHIHYVHLDKPYKPGTKLLLSCEIDGETAYIPIYVKQCTPAPNGELTNGHLSGAGYYITPREKKEGKTITAEAISDKTLHPKAPLYEVQYGIDTRRTLDKSALKPEHIRRLQRESLHQLQHAYELLEPQVALAHAAYHRAFPPKEMRGTDFDKEAYFSDADKSLVDAFLYIRKTGDKATLLPFLRSMASTHESLSQQLKSDGRPTPKPGSAEPNELSDHQKELSGFTHIYTDQGSGMLTAMGLKTRIAVRGPLLTHTGKSRDNQPQTNAVIAVDYKQGSVKRTLTIPIMVDRSDAPTFYASQITDEIAHLHGHKNSKAMRKSLRIGENENPILYSYAYRLAMPEELIWFDQKGEDIVMNMTQSFHDIWAHSNKDSVRSAKHFLEEQCTPEEREKGLERITPFREIRGTEKANKLAEENAAGNGRAPQSSIAFRNVLGVHATTMDHGPSHEHLRRLITAQKAAGRS